MLRTALVTFAVLLAGCRVGGPLQGSACVVDPTRVRPLLLGDSVRLATARVDRTQCRAPDSTRYQWTVAPGPGRAVARVAPGDWVLAQQVGPFRLEGRADTLLLVDGFVLPAGWRPRLRLPVQQVTVGDTLWVAVDALDARGRPLPWVPYDVATSDDIQFLADGAAPRPLGLRYLSPGTPTRAQAFIAEAAGRVTLRGYIGAQRDTLSVEVRPAARVGAI